VTEKRAGCLLHNPRYHIMRRQLIMEWSSQMDVLCTHVVPVARGETAATRPGS